MEESSYSAIEQSEIASDHHETTVLGPIGLYEPPYPGIYANYLINSCEGCTVDVDGCSSALFDKTTIFFVVLTGRVRKPVSL